MPTPQAQFKACCHFKSRKGALLISVDGDEKNAQWVPGSQISAHFINRSVAIVTMPEWLAVKKGFMQRGALGYGAQDDKFTDRPRAAHPNG